jgi:hypothetical protein
VLARTEVGERVDARRLGLVLLGEPDLVAAEQRVVQQRGVVRAEDQLRPLRVERRVVEHSDESPHQQRVQAAVEFVDNENAPVPQHIEYRRRQAEESLGAFRLLVELELRRSLFGTVLEDREQELALLLPRLRHTTGLEEELSTQALARHGQHVGDRDVGRGKEVAHGHAPLRGLEQRRGEGMVDPCPGGQVHDALHQPVRHRTQQLAVELRGRRQEQRVRARAVLPQLARAGEVGAELVLVALAALVQPAAEPLRRLGGAPHHQLLADDAFGRHREAVLMTHTVGEKADLEFGGLRGGTRIQPERLHVVGLAWLHDRGRLGDHRTQVVDREQQRALAAGVRAIDHGRPHRMRQGLQSSRRQMRGRQFLVGWRRHQAQRLLVADGAVVADAELKQHGRRSV